MEESERSEPDSQTGTCQMDLNIANIFTYQ
jgi:hypothetical protein